MIYELIRLAATFKEEKKSEKKEFSPSFNLILFEEPEAFLHPSQQENMTYQLRRIAAEEGQQVIITTHSPIFVGKAAEHMGQIVRFQRTNGSTQTFQPKGDKIKKIFDQGADLLQALQKFVDDPNIQDSHKKNARVMIQNPPHVDIARQQEKFRFQCWLDSKRAELFFANRVLLVEGATERALFNYLLANNWHDLSVEHICIVDVLRKYNIHRYMGLLEVYSIPHGVMLDSDNDKTHHGAINDLVKESKNGYTLAEPVIFPDCLESFLGLPKNSRDDMKPIEILKAITTGIVADEKLAALRFEFCKALNNNNPSLSIIY